MANILIVYGSTEGQTRKVVDFIASLLRDAGHTTLTADAEAVRTGPLLPEPDAVIVAASVHQGKHQDAVLQFVLAHAELLDSVPSAFLSVSLSARDEARRPEASGYVRAFLDETGWKPVLVDFVAGAIRYTSYGFAKKLVIRHIAKKAGLPTDTSRDYEYTDWEEVRRFTSEFSHKIEPAAYAGTTLVA